MNNAVFSKSITNVSLTMNKRLGWGQTNKLHIIK